MTTCSRSAVRILAALSIALVPATSLAQEVRDRTVEQYTCKDVTRESGADRDVAIAFLHGFLLGKSGGSKFNLDTLRKQSSDFIERCLDNPGERAVEAMSRIKN